MTVNYWLLYKRMFRPGDFPYSEREQADVADEMRRVVEAPDDEAASAVIQWWNTFDQGPAWNKTAVSCAREIRRRAARAKA